MKVIKITAIWCSACLIMNKIWNQVLEEYEIETKELDFDQDEEEVMSWNPGDVLPVFIFMKDLKEIKRITGEKSKKELIQIIEELDSNEEIS